MKNSVTVGLSSLLLLFLFSSILAQRDAMLVKVYLPTPQEVEQFRELGLTLATHSTTDHVRCFLVPEQLMLLHQRGFEFEVLVPPECMKGYLFGEDGIIDPEYHTYWETVAELDSLASSFPNISRLDSIGTSARFDHTIWCLKISDNPGQDEDEPNVMFNGMHHGHEAMGNEVCLGLMKYLLDNYGTDPQVTDWVDNMQVYVIPIVNPDGYIITVDSSWYWRKNCRDNNENGILDDYDGVDLNRNYDFFWEWGGSGDPSWPIYRGPHPFSEAEIQALRDLGLERRFVFSITYHTYAAQVYYPWGLWREPPDTGYYENAPDHPVLTTTATEMASRINRQFGGTYGAYQTVAECGLSHNWFYGVAGTHEFTIELCDSQPIPPGDQIQGIVEANLPGPFYLLDRLSGPGLSGHISDAQTSLPLSAEVEILEATSPVLAPRTSDLQFGRYFRILEPGDYTARVGKEGYGCEYRNVVIGPGALTIEDFQLDGNQVPSTFFLLSPADGDTVPTPIAFEWEPSVDPDPGEEVSYDIVISISPSFHFDSVMTIHNVEQNQYISDSLIFTRPHRYFWKVRAHDDFCGNTYSNQTFSFFAFNLGDVNTDGVIDIGDVVFLLNFLYRNGDPPNLVEAGDANCDGIVNVADVVYLVNYLYRGGDPPSC
jgi:murein tripeptide amidase MpaA